MVRPIFERDAEVGMPLYTVANDVDQRMRALVSSVVNAPTPTTLEGLRTLALAMANDAESRLTYRGDGDREYALAARALLVAAGTLPPPGLLGFGGEPEFETRERMLLAKPWRLPEWAQGEVAAAA